MAINQIFKKCIPKFLLLDLLSILYIKSLEDKNEFSKLLIEKKIVEIKEIMEEIERYYLPCKRKIYFKDLDYLKVIKILRHCLRLYKKELVSKEKYCKEFKKKIVYYRIEDYIDKEDKKKINKNKYNIVIKKQNIVLSFD